MLHSVAFESVVVLEDWMTNIIFSKYKSKREMIDCSCIVVLERFMRRYMVPQ